MGFQQFANSLHQIIANPHVPNGRGLARHLHWQFRKIFDLFPFEQSFSSSRIIAAHKACSVSALIHSQGLYDYNNMKLLQWLLQPGRTFFDIGANIGTYTLLASERDQAQVLAFEPHPATFALLSENVHLNKRQNVRLFQVALSHQEHPVYLTNMAGSPTNHIVQEKSLEAEPCSGVKVPGIRADQICQELGVVPDIVKLDVEGFEFDVLCGFGGFLKSIGVLLIEINGLSDQRGTGRASIHRLLTGRGLKGPYQCFFDLRQLKALLDHHREDHIYMSAETSSRLVRNGWTVESLA
jgi:FkbM family methyltransferase